MTVEDARLSRLRAVIESTRACWADEGEAVVDSGAEYVAGEPVRIRIRKRGRKYDLDDLGEAVERAGKPSGWLELAERLLAQEGFNVNRRGVVFVGAFEGRDLASLTLRLADRALAVHAALLDEQD